MTDDPWLKVILFIFRLIPYLLSITGNMIIIILILMDPHLKIPMYFFLQNFSFLEISYTTACIPNLRVMMATGDKNISYSRCFSQVFFVFLPGVSEFYLLAAMFYDHYVAICKPLHYTTIINSKICIQLVFCCWIAGCFTTFVPFLVDLKLFSCLQCCWAFLLWHNCPHADLLPRHTHNWDSGIHVCCNDSCGHISNGDNIIYLYCKSKSKIPSSNQREKAFTTCSPHMIVISLSYGSCIFIYVKPSVQERISFSKGIAVLNTFVVPLLNPFIYSLQNEVKMGFMNMIGRVVSFSYKLILYFTLYKWNKEWGL